MQGKGNFDVKMGDSRSYLNNEERIQVGRRSGKFENERAQSVSRV